MQIPPIRSLNQAQLVEQSHFRCCEFIKDLARKICTAVRDFFSRIREGCVNFFDHCKRKITHPPLANPVPIVNAHPPEPAEPHDLNPNPVQQPVDPVEIQAPPIVVEEPLQEGINLEELRDLISWSRQEAKQWIIDHNDQLKGSDFIHLMMNSSGFREEIRKHAVDWAERNHWTSENFNALADEYPIENGHFPMQRNIIGDWASDLVKDWIIFMDPDHPYKEIFDALAQFRSESEREPILLEPNFYHSASVSRYNHVYETLLAFQELSRPENRELIKKLDNKASNWGENRAYKFARAVSRLNVYPINGDMTNKLLRGIERPMAVFAAVKSRIDEKPELMYEFMMSPNGGFDPSDYCFDARVTRLETYYSTLNVSHDFTILLPKSPTNTDRAYEYFKVFKYRQILKYIARKAGDTQALNSNTLHDLYGKHLASYKAFKSNILNAENSLDPPFDREIADFFNNWITKDKFDEFIKEENLSFTREFNIFNPVLNLVSNQNRKIYDPIIGDDFDHPWEFL